MTRRGILGTLLAGATALLAGCNFFSGKHSYRYRLTIEVETPQGARSGSSVIEVSASESSGLNGRTVHSELRGQAVAVEMPNGNIMFALLKSVDGRVAPYASAAYNQTLPESITKNPDWRVFHDAIAHQTASAEVPAADYPIFVRFTDIRDPGSVLKVDVTQMDSDFGIGVKLKRIFVQITQEAVTLDIDKRLTWLPSFYHGGNLVKGGLTDNSIFGQELGDGDFIEGERQ